MKTNSSSPTMRDLGLARLAVKGQGRLYDPNRVMPKMCATCPWRQDGQGLVVSEDVAVALMTDPDGHNQYCHSPAWRGKPEDVICRGHRDHWTAFFHSEGFLGERSDAAWSDALRRVCSRT